MVQIRLALVWGHFPVGLVTANRSIVRGYEFDSLPTLARFPASGKRASTIFRRFGLYTYEHASSKYPVTLTEMRILRPFSRLKICNDYQYRLHAISLGFPILGECDFLNEVNRYVLSLPIPDVNFEGDVKLQEWIDNSKLVMSDSLSGCLLERPRPLELTDSALISYSAASVDIDDHMEVWLDHPWSVKRVKRIR